MSQPTSKISLSFSKKIEKRNLKVSAIGNDNFNIPEPKNKHSISSFDKSTKLLAPKANEVVIPLVESKREAIFEKLKQKSKEQETKSSDKQEDTENQNKELSLDEQAAAAVLQECSQKLKELENKQTPNSGLAIQVNVADTFESPPDQSAEVSTLEEYDQINVDCFGAAMLRGMGWKKGKGVGKMEKVVEIVTPTSKTFGTTTTEGGKEKDAKEAEEEEEELQKGSKVLIHSGRNRGTYGTVETIDEDHLLIRPAKGEHILREVEQNVRVVSAKEFRDLSRVINKNMYDEYKAAQDKKKEKQDDTVSSSKDSKKRRQEESERRETNDKKYKNEDGTREKKVSSDCKREIETTGGREKPLVDKDHYHRREEDTTSHRKAVAEEYSSSSKKRHERIDGKASSRREEETKQMGKEAEVKEHKKSKRHTHVKQPSAPVPIIPWARENLRVRIIDKQYQRGIYHKQKVIVRSVETVDNCTCVTDDGKVLYDVDPDHLETVIPKMSGATVLVVKGKYKGQKARILELDKYKEQATLQFFSDKSILVKLHYDDICEFVAR